ncbi:MAG: DegT/DnrJ/EryC1/StrS family aminotransferase, partial [SAR202 cluster bacterium]|nr:DegT/DnrJ/EryC1/StrS family aminotransferase [SAR202 cluster bacterium]
MAAVEGVLAHGNFIQGKELADFEEEFAAYCGTRFAIGVANGTDALVLALKAVGVGPGDEVITAPNSFLASASAVMMAGAKPTFVDVGDDYNLDASIMEQAITRRTKVILPVHLTGRPADMRAILDIARRRGLAVIEDAAQAVGSIYRGQKVGSFGAAGCFSFHPLKNLNACGDGGMITTDDEAIYRFAMKARNHGLRSRDEWEFCSLNSRLDTLQAAILSVKLRHLEDWAQARRRNAAAYSRVLDGLVQVPVEGPDERAVYQTYVVQCKRR